MSASEFHRARRLREAQGSPKGPGMRAVSFGSFSCPHKKMNTDQLGGVNPAFPPGCPAKVPFCKNTARRGKMLFAEPSSLIPPFLRSDSASQAGGAPARRPKLPEGVIRSSCFHTVLRDIFQMPPFNCLTRGSDLFGRMLSPKQPGMPGNRRARHFS